MTHAGLELARRLETAEARSGVACAQAHARLNPEVGATVLPVAGGFALFVGVHSPLTHSIGMGMHGKVAAGEIDRMEEFYRTRGAAIGLELCPLADASLVETLGARGYRTAEFNNVLVRSLAGVDFNAVDTVRQAGVDEEHRWAQTVGRGFLEKDDLTDEEIDVGRAIWHMQGTRCYFASDPHGRAAAAGAMTIHDGLAILFADSTLLGARGGGRQVALIRERLRVAVAEGCNLATASTLPGSVSQRNYERNGFQVAYTKAILAR